MPSKSSITFGIFLRATRLRYYYVPSRDCFVRISDSGKHFLVELVPNKVHFLGGAGKKLYRVLEEPEKYFQLSPVLSCIRSVKRPFRLVLDNSGEIVR